MSTIPPKRRPTAGEQTVNSEQHGHSLGGESEAAEGIHGVGSTTGTGADTDLEGRTSGVSVRDGAKRAESEPLLERSVQHKSGYGGERGAPRTSSDQREHFDAEGRLKGED